MQTLMPVLFISHGAPIILDDGTKAADFFSMIGKTLPHPKAIVCVSAHWEPPVHMVSVTEHPETIYDFYGFPKRYYELKYPAKGNPSLAVKLLKTLNEKGIECRSAQRGLDHGAWVPLLCMYPDADIPIFQLSLKRGASPKELFETGRALRELRSEGVLFILSGSATHNLYDFGKYPAISEPAEYAQMFDNWLEQVLAQGDTTSLLNWITVAPEAKRNHPTHEHLNPIFIAAGLSDSGKAEKVHNELVYGIISMAAFIWND
jgi:4,5-DOPA dioxygenase extradiol